MSEARSLLSGLFVGRVTHVRTVPRRHALSYRVFFCLFDLDELDGLARATRLFSRNAFNLLSFHDADHLDGGTALPLRARVDRLLAAAGIALDGGRVRLLCMPRVLGHAFNPLSVYFCHDRAGDLTCMVYEVNNTFGQRHSYVIPVEEGAARRGGVVRQSCAKRFYVSPFMDMDLTYGFAIEQPGASVRIAVTASDATQTVIATAFRGSSAPFTDRAILRAAAAHPLLGLKVLAGIHWEALWIWLKGIRLRVRPAPPSSGVTVTASPARSPASPWHPSDPHRP